MWSVNSAGGEMCIRDRAQDAHEAIRPTFPTRTPEELKPYLGRDELRLYRLIWERFLASQMAPAVYDTVAAEIDAGGYTSVSYTHLKTNLCFNKICSGVNYLC